MRHRKEVTIQSLYLLYIVLKLIFILNIVVLGQMNPMIYEKTTFLRIIQQILHQETTIYGVLKIVKVQYRRLNSYEKR